MQQLRVTYVAGVVPGKWIDRFIERYPLINMTAERLDDGDALARLDENQSDVVFVRFALGHNPRDETRHVIPLYEEQEVICAAKDHDIEYYDQTVSQADVASFPLLDLAQYPEAAGGVAMALEVVASGGFVARMPMSLARLHARKDVIYRVIDDGNPTQIGIAWLADSEKTELIDEFIGVVRGRSASSSRQVSVREKQQQGSAKTKRTGKPTTAKSGQSKSAKQSTAKRPTKGKPRKRR